MEPIEHFHDFVKKASTRLQNNFGDQFVGFQEHGNKAVVAVFKPTIKYERLQYARDFLLGMLSEHAVLKPVTQLQRKPANAVHVEMSDIAASEKTRVWLTFHS